MYNFSLISSLSTQTDNFGLSWEVKLHAVTPLPSYERAIAAGNNGPTASTATADDGAQLVMLLLLFSKLTHVRSPTSLLLALLSFLCLICVFAVRLPPLATHKNVSIFLLWSVLRWFFFSFYAIVYAMWHDYNGAQKKVRGDSCLNSAASLDNATYFINNESIGQSITLARRFLTTFSCGSCGSCCCRCCSSAPNTVK